MQYFVTSAQISSRYNLRRFYLPSSWLWLVYLTLINLTVISPCFLFGWCRVTDLSRWWPKATELDAELRPVLFPLKIELNKILSIIRNETKLIPTKWVLQMGKEEIAKHILHFLNNYYYHCVDNSLPQTEKMQDQGCSCLKESVIKTKHLWDVK